VFDGTTLNASTGTPVIRATASTTNALYGFELNGGALDAFVKAQPNNSELRIASGRSAGWGGYTTFYIDTAEAMRLTSTGLGIGTSSPGTRLHTNKASQTPGDVTPSGAFLVSNTSAGAGCVEIGSGSSVLGYLQVRNTGSQTYYDFALQPNGGNVGIGTSSPASKLDVVGGTGIRVTEDGAGTKIIQVRSNFAGVGPAINVVTNDPLLFQTNNTERARITSGGDFGIGTSSPQAMLDVAGRARGGLTNRKGVYTAGATTPSVSGVSYLDVSNSSATTITNFTNGVEGQLLYLLFRDGNTTITRNNAYLAGGTNFTSAANATLLLISDGTSWYEVSQSTTNA
jgi:hypothetical protein